MKFIYLHVYRIDSNQIAQQKYPELSFYSKLGGLSKWWDGYDNDPIVIIDDPGIFDPQRREEEIVYFKNIISTGAMEVEVKCGSMQFDSQLVIMSANFDPSVFYRSAGIFHQDSIQDRLEGGRSICKKSIYVAKPEHTLMLARNLIAGLSVVAKNIGVHFEPDVVYHAAKLQL
jgi:hypothetical protein